MKRSKTPYFQEPKHTNGWALCPSMLRITLLRKGSRRIRENFYEIILPLQGFIEIFRLESSAILKDLSAYPLASLIRWMLDLLLTSISILSMAVKRLYRHRDDDMMMASMFSNTAAILEKSSIRWVVSDSELCARCSTGKSNLTNRGDLSRNHE